MLTWFINMKAVELPRFPFTLKGIYQRGWMGNLAQGINILEMHRGAIDRDLISPKRRKRTRHDFWRHPKACCESLLVKGQAKLAQRASFSISDQQPVGQAFETRPELLVLEFLDNTAIGDRKLDAQGTGEMDIRATIKPMNASAMIASQLFTEAYIGGGAEKQALPERQVDDVKHGWLLLEISILKVPMTA